MTDLQTLTDERLAEHFDQLYDELPDGGYFGWDWPTLRAVLPDQYIKLHAIRQETRRRLHVNGRFLDITANIPSGGPHG